MWENERDIHYVVYKFTQRGHFYQTVATENHFAQLQTRVKHTHLCFTTSVRYNWHMKNICGIIKI